VDHAILQDALPLIFNTSNLEWRFRRAYATVSNNAKYLVVSAEHNVAHARALIRILLTFGI